MVRWSAGDMTDCIHLLLFKTLPSKAGGSVGDEKRVISAGSFGEQGRQLPTNEGGRTRRAGGIRSGSAEGAVITLSTPGPLLGGEFNSPVIGRLNKGLITRVDP
eukprot:1184723-Prorocentrum_minimum.AAC.4